MSRTDSTVQHAELALVQSKLPSVGTTIFTVMSALAQEHRAVNLGQGFPDFDCDTHLVDAVTEAMRQGHNQYPPMSGVAALRMAIADKILQLYGRSYDADTEITVTAGATQAILTTILALVGQGDEVIVLEPAYDSYVPAIVLAGAKPVLVRMLPPRDTNSNFCVPWDAVRAAVTSKTRALIINSPHNPSGATFNASDMRSLEELVQGFGLLVFSDEVYEHMVFDGHRHESVCRYPGLADRSVVISSFGKTFHVTGWKIGYVAAPLNLMREFRKVHQFNVFTVNTPMQYALANYLADPRPYLELPAFYQTRRDLFRAGLENTRFAVYPCSGTYFQLVDYRPLQDRCGALNEQEFCRWLTSEVGVAAIPVSAFYDVARESGIVRFCFAKRPETLQAAIDRLVTL